MILSKINKQPYINKLIKLIKILNKTQVFKQTVKKLVVFLKKKIKLKKKFLSNKVVTSKGFNQNTIRYVINIISFSSNTIINVTDVNGTVLVSISEGSIDLSKDSKKSQRTSVLKILKVLLAKAGFIKNKAVAVNFKNVKRYQESFFIKVLKPKIFIKSVQSFTLLPHNGCRPRKLKRRKFRTKRLVIK